jgi:hypothetical protein
MAVDFVQPTQVAPVDEQPVFAARSSRRPRALRIGGRAAAILTALWVVGLAIGAFGFGYLPGLKLPSSHQRSATPPPVAASTAPVRGSAAADAVRAVSRALPPALTRHGDVRSRGSAGSLRHRGNASSARGKTATRNHGSKAVPGASARGNGTHSIAPGSRSGSLTSPGRSHSSGTPTPGTGTRGATHTHAAGSSKTAQ